MEKEGKQRQHKEFIRKTKKKNMRNKLRALMCPVSNLVMEFAEPQMEDDKEEGTKQVELTKLRAQVEFYFGDSNLNRDLYL